MSDPTPGELRDVKVVEPVDVNIVSAPDVRTSLKRTDIKATDDQGLWVAIRNRAEAIGFREYYKFIDKVLCQEAYAEHGGVNFGKTDERYIGAPTISDRRKDLSTRPAIHGVDAYNLLRFATEVFLLVNAGVVKVEDRTVKLLDPDLFKARNEGDRLESIPNTPTPKDIEELLTPYFGQTSQLPYLRRVLRHLPVVTEESPYCESVLQSRLSSPSLIELIWSYWLEEGMLVQTLKAIALRFQNRRGPSAKDPLANLELDPLRPLNNLLWGYIQDEYRQLTVVRRAYEYDHHYGFTLVGKAVPKLDAADSRSKFIEAFHNLLHRAAMFYKEDADTTVIADGFALLNALREVHLLLAEGAHNQFGDLPWTARTEMLIEQWLLARPEMQEFLRGRYMVPYQEEWMGAVDAMKRLQGWTDVSITYFYNAAVFGERLLLSIRYGDWFEIDNTNGQAKNWARYWRPEIQGYIHAYQAVTGVDLTADVVSPQDLSLRYTQPSILLSQRLSGKGMPPMLPEPPQSTALLPFHARRAARK